MALSCALRLKSKSQRRAQTFELLVVVADRPSLRQNCKLAADRTNRLQRPWKPIQKKKSLSDHGPNGSKVPNPPQDFTASVS